MDTNQQPKAAHLAQELKAGEWSPNILQNEVALRQCAAEELLRQHAEIETLRTGYDAARLVASHIANQRLARIVRDSCGAALVFVGCIIAAGATLQAKQPVRHRQAPALGAARWAFSWCDWCPSPSLGMCLERHQGAGQLRAR